MTRRALDFVRRAIEEQRPFFLLAHYFDPHYNYRAHPEFGFAPARAGRLDGTEDIITLRQMLGDLSEEEVQYLQALYDEEIRYTDAGIGRLLDGLRTLGVEDDTLVIVTGDHGEEFLDHGWIGHTRTLHQELLRVPLIIRAPGRARREQVVLGRVSLVSLMPTVLDLARIDRSKLAFHAESLAGLLDRRPVNAATVVFSEVDHLPIKPEYADTRAFKKAILAARFKLIRDETGRLELYDLDADPLERTNLVERGHEVVAELLPILDRSVAVAREAGRTGQDVELSPKQIEQLRSLGYAG